MKLVKNLEKGGENTMNTKLKRFLSLLFAVAMLASSLSFSTIAADSTTAIASNPAYTLKGIDGGSLSTSASGKPKVLLFFKYDCYNCQRMLNMFKESNYDFSGVDIIAAEFCNASLEDVKSFYKTYGCSSVKYGYDANSIGFSYVRLLEGGNSIATPLVVYVNKSNEIVYYTKGMNTNIIEDIKGKLGVSLSEKRYAITYNLNGGNNSSSNLSTYAASETITLADPSRKGYTFGGWYSNAGLTNKVTKIPSGSSGDKTFYAKWTANKYTIKYNGNGNTSTGTMKSMSCSYGKTYTLTENTYKKSGYKFKGWNTKADGSGTNYQDAASIKNLTSKSGGTVTLYAQWSKVKYTITYNLNDGTNASSNPSAYYVNTADITLQAATRKGYTFNGWYSDSAYTKKVTTIKKGSTGNKTLYAKWTTNKYTIKFNGNGNTNTGTKMSNISAKYGKSVTLSSNAYKKSGYRFKGWNTKADGSGTSYQDGASVRNLTSKSGGTVTLYAQWSKVKYTITYNLNGGKNNSNNPSSYYITTSTITLQSPTRSGYSFGGWYSDSGFTKKVTTIDKGSTGNKTLYAKWSKKKYTITYKLNGGTANSANPTSYYVTTDTITLQNPTRKGYTFKGWYSDSSYTKKVITINKGSTGNKTLYARWSVSTYYLKFDNNGGHGATIVGNSDGYQYDTCYMLPICNAVRNGYFFVGWNTKADGSGRNYPVDYEQGGSAKNITSVNGKTVTLYANWQKVGSEEQSYAEQVVDLVNKERTAAGLSELAIDEELMAIAQRRADEITEYFSHTRPDGSSSCFSLYNAAGYSYRTAGENIAYGYNSPENVMSGWMNSSGHKANILSGNFTKIGVGCFYYNGRYYWVQNFS